MADEVIVPHNAIFALCSHIHSCLRSKEEDFNWIDGHDDGSVLYRLIHDKKSLEYEIEDLRKMLSLALDCAPDDIRDFFLHYDDVIANCPF